MDKTTKQNEQPTPEELADPNLYALSEAFKELREEKLAKESQGKKK